MAADKHNFQTRHDVLKLLRKSGRIDGDTIDRLDAMKPAEARSWFEKNVDLDGVTPADVEALWTKKVTVSVAADAGEEVEVMAPEGAPAEAEPEETEASPEPKSYARPRATGAKPGINGSTLTKAVSIGNSRVNSAKAMYARAVRDGAKYRGERPPIADPDMAEAFGAWFRLAAMGSHGYSEKDNDRSIVRNVKELSGGQNLLGGATVPIMFQRELIENRANYGAVNRAVGVTTLDVGQNMMARLIDDVTVSVVGENAADTDQDKPEFDNVEMNAREVRGLLKIPASLINDSAIDIVGTVGGSFDRASAKFADLNFLLSRSATGASSSFQGILDKIGSTSTYDAQLNASWEDYTIAKVQNAIGKLSDRSWDASSRIGWICSRPFFDSVLERFALSAGGNTGDGLYRGYRTGGIDNADASWNGYPVWFTPKMPRTYAADQKVALFGAFDAACKVGVVAGSTSIMTSEHAYFANNQIGVRFIERIAFNAHDVNDTSDPDTGSMVVALQD